ncbi:MAG: DUF2782 domain-containing protein [Azoarcus sp.]|jgi:hypothetical protein|nr:DUF2782 domain-containing protein [Azoarcus sp.]
MRTFPITAALVFCSGLFSSGVLFAQEPPPALEPLDEELPQVTAVKQGETITEYRYRGGKPYMVKVTPKNAPAYYLFNQESKGRVIPDDNANRRALPTWTLTNW